MELLGLNGYFRDAVYIFHLKYFVVHLFVCFQYERESKGTKGKVHWLLNLQDNFSNGGAEAI